MRCSKAARFSRFRLGRSPAASPSRSIAGIEAACLLLVVCAVAGFAASFRVPPARSPGARAASHPQPPSPRPPAILRQAWEIRAVKLSILGSSWFWLVGAVFLSDILAFAKETLGGRHRRRNAVSRRLLGRDRGRFGAVRPADARRGQRPLRAAGRARHGALFARPRLLPAGRPSRRRRRAARRRRVPVRLHRAAHLCRSDDDRDLRRAVHRTALRDHPAPQRRGERGPARSQR